MRGPGMLRPLLCLALAGCWVGSDEWKTWEEQHGVLDTDGSEGDSDTDADADGDTDADGDADTDADQDVDGDGWTIGEGDCDDADPGIHPDASEITADGVDQDCDGVDTCYQDSDDDNFGTSVVIDGSTLDCVTGTGAPVATDCDDEDAAVHPGATETCGDGVDQDCDGADAKCPYTGTFDLGSYGIEFVGEEVGDYAGISVSGAGDVNGDGFDDILVGAYMNDYGGEDAGAAYLLYGPLSAGRDLSLADAKLVGEDAGEQAGYSLSGAGDVDGDGFDDLLVGAPHNGDGGPDAGAAYLLYGPLSAGRDLSLADAKLVGEDAGDMAGFSISGAGDVDGDGFDDLLVGARGDDDGGTDSGAAYLLFGPLSADRDLSGADAKLVGEAVGDSAGVSVSGAGDVDGDGFDDLLVGAPYDDDGGSDAGAAYLLYGPLPAARDLSLADAKLVGEDAYDVTGWSVSDAGDVDNDGFDDLLAGAGCNDGGGENAGAAYLLYGPLSASRDLSLADAKLVGGGADDRAGFGVSSAGDVDDDGFDDLLVGAASNDDGGSDAGAAYLILFADMP